MLNVSLRSVIFICTALFRYLHGSRKYTQAKQKYKRNIKNKRTEVAQHLTQMIVTPRWYYSVGNGRCPGEGKYAVHGRSGSLLWLRLKPGVAPARQHQQQQQQQQQQRRRSSALIAIPPASLVPCSRHLCARARRPAVSLGFCPVPLKPL